MQLRLIAVGADKRITVAFRVRLKIIRAAFGAPLNLVSLRYQFHHFYLSYLRS
jgi:hypothetical protein